MPQGGEKDNYELSIGVEILKDVLNKIMCQLVALKNEKINASSN